MNKIAAQFGSNLRYCRRRARCSQEDLAYRASLHRTEIGLLERGERVPRIDTLIKLSGALDISPEELLDGIEWHPVISTLGGFEIAPSNDEQRGVG